MGCWNGTCILTNLPIFDGDNVRGFVIYDPYVEFRAALPIAPHPDDPPESIQPDLSNFSYAIDKTRPVGPALRGKYCGYGSMKQIESDSCAEILEAFLKEQDLKYARKHDIKFYAPKGLAPLSLDDLTTVIERGMIPGLGLVLVHEFAFQQLLQDQDSRSFAEKTMKEAREFQIFLREDKQLSDLPPFSKRLLLTEGRNILLDKIFLVGPSPDPDYASETPLAKEDVMEIIIEHLTFCSEFESLRRHWGPSSGAGSQSSFLTSHRRLLKASLSFIDDIEKKEMEELGDEYDPKFL